jgi:hypothetical protein
MPNGKPGDNPITDTIIHGKHIFPTDIEKMIKKLHSIDPKILNQLGDQVFDWEEGKNLGNARKILSDLIKQHENIG